MKCVALCMVLTLCALGVLAAPALDCSDLPEHAGFAGGTVTYRLLPREDTSHIPIEATFTTHWFNSNISPDLDEEAQNFKASLQRVHDIDGAIAELRKPQLGGRSFSVIDSQVKSLSSVGTKVRSYTDAVCALYSYDTYEAVEVFKFPIEQGADAQHFAIRLEGSHRGNKVQGSSSHESAGVTDAILMTAIGYLSADQTVINNRLAESVRVNMPPAIFVGVGQETVLSNGLSSFADDKVTFSGFYHERSGSTSYVFDSTEAAGMHHSMSELSSIVPDQQGTVRWATNPKISYRRSNNDGYFEMRWRSTVDTVRELNGEKRAGEFSVWAGQASIVTEFGGVVQNVVPIDFHVYPRGFNEPNNFPTVDQICGHGLDISTTTMFVNNEGPRCDATLTFSLSPFVGGGQLRLTPVVDASSETFTVTQEQSFICGSGVKTAMDGASIDQLFNWIGFGDTALAECQMLCEADCLTPATASGIACKDCLDTCGSGLFTGAPNPSCQIAPTCTAPSDTSCCGAISSLCDTSCCNTCTVKRFPHFVEETEAAGFGCTCSAQTAVVSSGYEDPCASFGRFYDCMRAVPAPAPGSIINDNRRGCELCVDEWADSTLECCNGVVGCNGLSDITVDLTGLKPGNGGTSQFSMIFSESSTATTPPQGVIPSLTFGYDFCSANVPCPCGSNGYLDYEVVPGVCSTTDSSLEACYAQMTVNLNTVVDSNFGPGTYTWDAFNGPERPVPVSQAYTAGNLGAVPFVAAGYQAGEYRVVSSAPGGCVDDFTLPVAYLSPGGDPIYPEQFTWSVEDAVCTDDGVVNIAYDFGDGWSSTEVEISLFDAAVDPLSGSSNAVSTKAFTPTGDLVGSTWFPRVAAGSYRLVTTFHSTPPHTIVTPEFEVAGPTVPLSVELQGKYGILRPPCDGDAMELLAVVKGREPSPAWSYVWTVGGTIRSTRSDVTVTDQPPYPVLLTFADEYGCTWNIQERILRGDIRDDFEIRTRGPSCPTHTDGMVEIRTTERFMEGAYESWYHGCDPASKNCATCVPAYEGDMSCVCEYDEGGGCPRFNAKFSPVQITEGCNKRSFFAEDELVRVVLTSSSGCQLAATVRVPEARSPTCTSEGTLSCKSSFIAAVASPSPSPTPSVSPTPSPSPSPNP